MKVVIICCDLRRPSIHNMFRLDNSKGLTNVLTGRVKLTNALQKIDIKNLKILPSGPLPPNPSELLGSTKMKILLSKMKDVADIILIDTPPILAVTDAAVLAPDVDGIMAVVSSGETTREVAKDFKIIL